MEALVLKFDNTVWGWGANSEGQLGNNSTDDSLTPVQTQGLTSQILTGFARGS